MNDLTAFLYREACMKGSKATEKIEKAKQAKLSFASEKCGVRLFLITPQFKL